MAAVSDDTILNWFKIKVTLVTCTLSRYYGIMPLPVFNIKSFKIGLKLKIKNLKLTKGFTLIELLVVISIIAILMAVATISYLNAQQKGRDNKRKSDLKAIQQALEIYYNQNGKYPYKNTDSAGYGGRISCFATPNNSGITWGSVFTCGTITYMNPTPKDPVFTPTTPTINQDYYYDSDNGTTPANQTYILSARLENTKDQENKGTFGNTLPCTPQGWASVPSQRNYCVINP